MKKIILALCFAAACLSTENMNAQTQRSDTMKYPPKINNYDNTQSPPDKTAPGNKSTNHRSGTNRKNTNRNINTNRSNNSNMNNSAGADSTGMYNK